MLPPEWHELQLRCCSCSVAYLATSASRSSSMWRSKWPKFFTRSDDREDFLRDGRPLSEPSLDFDGVLTTSSLRSPGKISPSRALAGDFRCGSQRGRDRAVDWPVCLSLKRIDRHAPLDGPDRVALAVISREVSSPACFIFVRSVHNFSNGWLLFRGILPQAG